MAPEKDKKTGYQIVPNAHSEAALLGIYNDGKLVGSIQYERSENQVKNSKPLSHNKITVTSFIEGGQQTLLDMENGRVGQIDAAKLKELFLNNGTPEIYSQHPWLGEQLVKLFKGDQ
ncbi:MAG: hypothetical protein NTU57_03010 [Candidatus Aenigmarchaeota archaeon]|nr:hypothetical protein [Candidatus Aenigmarchaeota archaeon]